MSEFDSAAEGYDLEFTKTCVGQAQREQVYRALKADGLDTNQSVLEINCGTGEDALQFHNWGNTILATDFSVDMLEVARKKFPEGEFAQLDMKNIGTLENQYSLIFSNFGGINCLSPEEFAQFLSDSSTRLSTNGHLVLVIMGKKCWWDNFYLLLKGKWSKLRRRNTTVPLEVNVGGTLVKTWYYSPKEVKRMLGENYQVRRLKPIGLYVPPSYIAPFFEKKGFLLSLLKFKDRFVRLPMFSNFSDHYYISLTKK